MKCRYLELLCGKISEKLKFQAETALIHTWQQSTDRRADRRTQSETRQITIAHLTNIIFKRKFLLLPAIFNCPFILSVFYFYDFRRSCQTSLCSPQTTKTRMRCIYAVIFIFLGSQAYSNTVQNSAKYLGCKWEINNIDTEKQINKLTFRLKQYFYLSLRRDIIKESHCFLDRVMMKLWKWVRDVLELRLSNKLIIKTANTM